MIELHKHKAACHCKAVQFVVTLKDTFKSARRCDCSFCRMRGAVVVSVDLDGIEFTGGQDKLTLYQFNTNAAKHYFCSVCGIYTHHQRRSSPDEFGVNVACLEGVSPFDFETVPVMNGVDHPMDTGKFQIAGKLNYMKSK